MGKALFYHLTRNPVDVTLTTLVGKALEQGWPILVRGGNRERLEWLDQKLWQAGGDAGFLPHGMAGGSHDADQPVLLTTAADNLNGAVYVVSIDGADITPDEVQAAERGVILFDGHDEAAVAHARTQWTSLTNAGCAAEYWSEDDGRWQKKAEKTSD
ncbi:DNA polymerase III subunit chi [uncultured Shimia sp.]|uniref:DNA polymerase III subunit chi n=1 Tax=uncultured Shimia sp. TaxID=573152 RepID=UPI0026191018|nr:DNA polymerase III subunit chi [uncultured Shimia sp.]